MIEVKIPFEIIELEDDSFHILTNIKLSNGEAGLMVIDTGASKTVLDKDFVGEEFFLEKNDTDLKSGGLGGEIMDINLCSLDCIFLGDFKIEKITLAVIDLSAINELYLEHCNKRIAALLGSDILLKYKAIIDYGKSEMSFFI